MSSMGAPADPHAGHVMAAPAPVPTSAPDPHAGHNMPASPSPASPMDATRMSSKTGMPAHPESEDGNALVDMQTMSPMARLDDPGIGLRDHGRKVLTYADLKSTFADPDGRAPSRTIELHLTGHMARLAWSFDGVKFSDAEPLRLKYGERLRIVLVNDTMMSHPIHLHGMWSDLENEAGEFQVRKHTIDMPPGTRRAYRVRADALGLSLSPAVPHGIRHVPRSGGVGMRRGAVGAMAVVMLLASAAAALAQTGTPAPVDPHAGHVQPPAGATPAGTAVPDAPTADTRVPVTPIPVVTDQDRAAAFPKELDGHAVHDGAVNYFVLLDQLEWQADGLTSGLNWDTTTWLGTDLNRVWLRSEGAAADGRARRCRGARPLRTVFRPLVGLSRGRAAGFSSRSDADVGRHRYSGVGPPVVRSRGYPLRWRVSRDPGQIRGRILRYEVRREVAPYIGLVWQRKLFGTADQARAANDGIGGWRGAAGLRMWF